MFCKNLATLPYGKLKYLTSILSRNFSAATSHGKDDMRFKTSSKLNSRVGAGASASTKQKFPAVKAFLGRVAQAPFEMLQGLLGKFGMGEFNAGPESMKRGDVASHGNAFEPVIAGGDESTFTDRLAQPGLEGYHPYMGYEAETPQCADSLSTYFKCSALNQGPNGRQTITDVRQRFLNFRAKHEGIYTGTEMQMVTPMV